MQWRLQWISKHPSLAQGGYGWVIHIKLNIFFGQYDWNAEKVLDKQKHFVLILGYYRTASDTNNIFLSDGRREMADSEFGAGSNAEKVIGLNLQSYLYSIMLKFDPDFLSLFILFLFYNFPEFPTKI